MGKTEGTIFMLILVASAIAEKPKWPFQKCSRNDPQVSECILRAARHALPLLRNGIKELKIPRMDPLDAGNYSMNVHRGPVSLDLLLEKLRIHGACTMNVTALNYDKDNLRALMDGETNKVVIDANYILSGKLFLVPINSRGQIIFTLGDLHIFHDITFVPRSTKKKSFVEMNINKIKFKNYENFHMNTYNPSIAHWANDALNKLLNDNSRLLFNSFSQIAEKMVKDVFAEALKPMMSNYSYDELLPETL